MTKDEIIEMARQAGSIDSEDVILTVYNAFTSVERERIFDELLKMHEIASSRHNYYLNAILTIKARGQA